MRRKWRRQKGQGRLFNPWWPSDHYRRIGRVGVAECRKVLEEKRPKEE